MSPTTNLRHQLFGAWCAPIFTVLTLVGWVGFAHFYDPAAASLSPAATADFFREHRDGILLGCSLLIVAVCPLALWTAQLGLQLREVEGASPLMAAGQVLAGVSIVVIVVIDASRWLGAARSACPCRWRSGARGSTATPGTCARRSAGASSRSRPPRRPVPTRAPRASSSRSSRRLPRTGSGLPSSGSWRPRAAA